MSDFSVFGDRERVGWADADLISSYVARFGPITDQAANLLCARAARPGSAVLDLCCGQGRLTGMLAEAGAEVTGLDFSPGMLELAAEAAPGANLVEADAADLPFADGSFDAVVCNFGMMHLPDQPAALAEIRRVLRPDGGFTMATWAEPAASPAFGVVFGTLKALADFSAAPPQPDFFVFARPASAGEAMAEAGLDLARHEIVTPCWELERPEELFEIFLDATVGAAMLIKAQAPETVAAIRDRITSAVAERFDEGGVYRVPVPVAVLEARPG